MGQGPVELLRSVPLFADLEAGGAGALLARRRRRAPSRPATRVFHEGDHSDACYIVRDGQLPGHPRALRRAGDHARHARPRRHLRRAGDARRRGALGQRRSADRRRAAGAAGGRGAGAAGPPSGDHGEAGRRAGAATAQPPTSASRASPSRPCPAASPASSPSSSPRSRPGRSGTAGEVTIRMNQADLAQLAGTSRESVSRFLADLERAGVVRSGRGRVTVLAPGEAPQLHLLSRAQQLIGLGSEESLTGAVVAGAAVDRFVVLAVDCFDRSRCRPCR